MILDGVSVSPGPGQRPETERLRAEGKPVRRENSFNRGPAVLRLNRALLVTHNFIRLIVLFDANKEKKNATDMIASGVEGSLLTVV